MLTAHQGVRPLNASRYRGYCGRLSARRLDNRRSLLVVLVAAAALILTGSKAGADEFGHALLSSLTVTGFWQNSTGMFTDSGGMRYTKSGNQLAAERNLLQLDVNDKPTEHDQIFVRFWAAYEPPYPIDRLSRSRGGKGAKSDSDFFNEYDFRDLWWEHTAGPLRLYTGRQIATWGQSISFRVGDVINPTDTSYAFGFANLEQSRLPIFMVHPILNLPNFGPLISNYAEGIFAPGIDDQWTHVDYQDDRYEGQNVIAGRVNILPPPLSRFGARPESKLSQFTFWNLSAKAPTNWKLPPVTPFNFQEGIRLHTLLGETEMAALFWHSHQYAPTIFRTQTPKGIGLRFMYPDFMAAGVTFDRPIYLANYMPEFLNKALEGAPFVVRGEGLYLNHAPYDSLNPLVSHSRAMSVTYSDTFNYMLALDLDQVSAPWLTATGTITANLEYQSLIILSQNKWMAQAPTYSQRPVHKETNLLFNVGTSWYWGVVAPTWTNIYNPQGNTFLLFPSVVLTPPWTNKYFVTLKYIGVFGSDKWSPGGGLLKGKSLILGQFQYNFNVNQLVGYLPK
jgi:hypothetical protein